MNNDRERFENWTKKLDPAFQDLITGSEIFFMTFKGGEKSRQPDIDALNDKVLTYRNLAECWQDRFNHQSDEKLKLHEENAALKAELRILRDGIQTMGDALADGVWAHLISSDDDLNALDVGISSVVGKLTTLKSDINDLQAENTRLRLVAEKYVSKELGEALDELEEEPGEKEIQVCHSVDQVNLWADLYDELGDYDQIVEMLRGYSHLLSVYESLKTAPQPDDSLEGK